MHNNTSPLKSLLNIISLTQEENFDFNEILNWILYNKTIFAHAFDMLTVFYIIDFYLAHTNEKL